MKNMLAGNYYSSSGPEIYDWGIRNGQAYIKCSAVRRIDFITGNRINDGRSILSKSLEETIQTAAYLLKGHETYVRSWSVRIDTEERHGVIRFFWMDGSKEYKN